MGSMRRECNDSSIVQRVDEWQWEWERTRGIERETISEKENLSILLSSSRLAGRALAPGSALRSSVLQARLFNLQNPTNSGTSQLDQTSRTFSLRFSQIFGNRSLPVNC